jgi:acyl-CoA reductase-like NAD-dependent aldehyde dehydrogenase
MTALPIREHKDDLGKLVSLEAGKILQEGLGEAQECIDIADFAVGLSRQLHGLTIASERPGHHMRETWHPLGTVGVITAFNFPIAVWAWNSMLALVCGDSCLWKPSLKTPLCAIAMTKIAAAVLGKEWAPLVGLCIGPDLTSAARCSTTRRCRSVSATGSTRMGRIVGPRVAQRFGRSLLELGGNNAIAVMDDADLGLAVRGIVFGAVGTAGQRCTTTRRLLVHEKVVDELRKARSRPTRSADRQPARQEDAGRPADRRGRREGIRPRGRRGRGAGRQGRRGGKRAKVGGPEGRRLRRTDDRALPARLPIVKRGDVRADPLRDADRVARRGDRAQQRRAAGPQQSRSSRPTCAPPSASCRRPAATAASPTSTSAPAAPRSAARSAARRRPAAAARAGGQLEGLHAPRRPAP